MTLWELAQTWPHNTPVGLDCEDYSSKHYERLCRRCQLEQWAREQQVALAERASALVSSGRTDTASELQIVICNLGNPEDK